MEKSLPMASLIQDAREFPGLGIEEVQRILGSAAKPEPGDEYQKMKDVTSIENGQVFPGTVYLKEDKVLLVRISSAALISFSEADLRTQFGNDAVRLRSRAGKHANLLVFAEQGIACSSRKEGLDFLEVFPPRSQREYEAQIYLDPGPFIR